MRQQERAKHARKLDAPVSEDPQSFLPRSIVGGGPRLDVARCASDVW